MKLEPVLLSAINILARIFGSLAALVGIVFLVCACVMKENRLLYFVLGLFLVALGVAFWLAKSISAEQLARVRRQMGYSGPPESRRRP